MKPLKTLNIHDMFIKYVRYSPNGQYILTSSGDKLLKITDSETYELVNKIEHESFVLAGEMSENLQYIATGSWDKILRIYDSSNIKDIKLLFEIQNQHQDWISSLSFSSDNNFVITSSADKFVRVFNLKTGQKVTEYSGHENMIYFTNYQKNGDKIISGDFSGVLKIWDQQKQKLESTFQPKQSQSTSTSAQFIGKQNDLMISSSWDGSLMIWDIETQEQLHTMIFHEQPISQVAVSNNQKYMVSVDEDSKIKIWDLQGILNQIEKNIKQINNQDYILGTIVSEGKQLWGTQIRQNKQNNQYEVIATGETGQLFIYNINQLVKCYQQNQNQNEEL